MEDLFSTNISFADRNINYRVVFDEEKYIFLSTADQKEFSSFSFRREHDEWIGQDLLPASVKEQATEALEKYLLRQH